MNKFLSSIFNAARPKGAAALGGTSLLPAREPKAYDSAALAELRAQYPKPEPRPPAPNYGTPVDATMASRLLRDEMGFEKIPKVAKALAELEKLEAAWQRCRSLKARLNGTEINRAAKRRVAEMARAVVEGDEPEAIEYLEHSVYTREELFEESSTLRHSLHVEAKGLTEIAKIPALYVAGVFCEAAAKKADALEKVERADAEKWGVAFCASGPLRALRQLSLVPEKHILQAVGCAPSQLLAPIGVKLAATPLPAPSEEDQKLEAMRAQFAKEEETRRAAEADKRAKLEAADKAERAKILEKINKQHAELRERTAQRKAAKASTPMLVKIVSAPAPELQPKADESSATEEKQ